MATLNFPTNPTLNQTYSFGGKTWVWNGQGWQLSASGAINNIPIGNITPASGAFTTLTANTFAANGITVLGNITGANLNATGNLSVAGNVNSSLNVRANVTATNFVTAGTLTAGIVSATGNVTGAYIIGDGSQLTNLPGVNYSNANVANYLPTYSGNLASLTGPVTTTGNLTGNNVVASGLVTAAGNITGGNLRTAGSITATGNITGGNLATGNIVSASINSSGLISAAGNITGAYIFGNGSQLTGLPATYSNANVAAYLPTYTGNLPNLTGPVTTTGNLTGGNILTSGLISAAGIITGGNVSTGNITAGNISTTGNVQAAYFLGDGSQLTNLPAGNYSNANVANYLPTYTGNLASLTGPVTTTANITGGNLRTAGSITATGNITGGNVATGNITGGNASIAGTISATGNVIGAYILGDGSQLTNLPTGNYSNANVAAYLPTYTGNLASLTGPVTTTSNITGGNLQTGGSLTVSGNVIGGNVSTGNVIAGNVSTVGNVQAAYFLGDGSQLTNLPAGNYSNANVANYLPTYTGNLASLTGPVTTTANVTGGNVLTAGLISATGNITGGNIATGNILAGNVSTAGNVSGTYILGDGSQLTNLPVGNYSNANVAAYLPTYTGNLASLTGPVTTTANITGGNLRTAGSITATGNIAGGNIATGNLVAANVESLGTVSAVGNVTGTYFIGNGAFLTGIASGNNNYSNANVAAYLPTYTGNLVSLTGPVITTGNITGGNVSTVGNVTANNLIANSRIKIGLANIYTTNFDPAVLQIQSEVVEFSGQIIAIGNVSGNNLSAVGNVVGSNIRTPGMVSATGNMYAANFVGNVTGNITVPGANTQILFNDGGLANASAGLTFNKTTQVLSVTGNIQGGNLRTAGLISATGNIAGQYFVGNGSLLTGIIATAGAAITNGNSNVTVSGNGNVTVTVAGVLNTTTFATTGVYVAGEVSATGNVAGSYLLGNGAFITGLPTGYSNADVAAYLPTYSGNLPSLTGLVSTTGNISGNYILGNGSLLTGIDATSIQNGTSNVRVVSSGGNVTIGVGGTGNVAVFATTGAYIAGEISATGNIAGNYFIGNGSQLTGVAASSVNANALIGNTLSANVLYSSLTTVGNLANLSVVGNTTSGNLLTGGLISATGNVDAGNINTVGLASVTGNITGGNLSTFGLITASGNISGNNIFATTLISVPGNVIAGNINTSAIRPTSGELTITTASGNLNLQPAGNIVLANTYINSVAYPQQDTDAATKLYVDNMVSTALTFHQAVYAATTTTLATTTGGSITYTQPNGAANGVGATLATTGTFDLIDTANVQTIGTRILVKNEANAVYNGVYTWANATNIVRSTDTDQYGPNSAEEISINDYFFVQNGAVNGGSAYVVDAPAGTITFGSSNIGFAQFSQASIYTANTSAGLSLIGSQFNAKVDNDTTAFDGSGNIIVKASANLTTPNIGAATGTSLSLTGNAISGNVLTSGLISATGNITGNYISGNGLQLTGILGNNVNMGTNTAGTLVSNAVTLTTATTVTNGLALLNQVLGKLVPPSPPNFPGANTLSLSGITTYRMANITQVDNTPGANRAVAAGTSVANVLRVATYATNTIANVGPGDSGTITAVRNGSNVGNVTLNTNASPSANGTYGSNLVISNNFDYNSANANITAGFWYVFSSRVSGASAPAGWNELYIADSSTGNTNTTVWYYDNSSPSAPSFSSTTMTPPGSANLLYSSTIPHYTNNNNFTIAFNVANISGNTYPTSNTLASGSSGGAFAAPTAITYSGSNIGSNVLNSFASASANTTASVTTGFGGSATGPSMTVNNSYSTGTLTLTAALGNTVLWKSGTATAIEESNVVINTTIGTGSGNAYRIVNPGTGNTPAYTGSEAAFNSQSSTLQTYDATVVGSGSSGVLKHDQTNYASGYLPAGPNLSAGRSGTQYFTIKFVRTAVSKFDIKYTGTIAGMWVALPGSVIDSSSSANGWINMAVAYGGAGYPGVNSPGNGSDGCAVGGVVSLNTSVTNSSKTCTFGTVSSSSTATNEIYVRIALTSGQSVTALTLETASN